MALAVASPSAPPARGTARPWKTRKGPAAKTGPLRRPALSRPNPRVMAPDLIRATARIRVRRHGTQLLPQPPDQLPGPVSQSQLPQVLGPVELESGGPGAPDSGGPGATPPVSIWVVSFPVAGQLQLLRSAHAHVVQDVHTQRQAVPGGFCGGITNGVVTV